jgi:hypothetical protein
VVALSVWLCAKSPSVGSVCRGAWIAVWLVAGSALVVTLGLRVDRQVEIEAPQVQKIGGAPVPRPGTVSRFRHRLGWRLEGRDSVEVPLRLRAGAEVSLEGKLLGTAQRKTRLVVTWNDDEPSVVEWSGEAADGMIRLPAPPGAGLQRLGITVRCPPNGAVVLDRVVVDPRPVGAVKLP